MADPAPRYRPETLHGFASALPMRLGLPADKAAAMADVLVEADMMGRSTHGIEMLAWYLRDLDRKVMTTEGDAAVVHDAGAAVTLDAGYRPGSWAVKQAMDLALERLAEHPVVTVVIRDSHHVGFHAAYLRRAAERGAAMLLLDTNPYFNTIAPYGGTRGVFSPTPIAYGFPTAGDPILVDFALASTSLTSTERAHRLGQKLPHPWIIDHAGVATDDPGALFADPPGTILPLGGADRGHKGYGLLFMVYALTAALGGFGTPASPTGYSSAVFLQLLDPAAFAGRAAFDREMQIIIDACHASPPAAGRDAVVVPGERAMAAWRDARANGVALFPTVLETLTPWAERLGVPLPEAV